MERDAIDVREPAPRRRRVMERKECEAWLSQYPGVHAPQEISESSVINKWEIEEWENYSSTSFTMDDFREYHTNPLLFWNKNASKYPCLVQIARYIFSIRASSASAERIFSIAGLVYRQNRARMDPNTLSSHVLLHDNKEFLSTINMTFDEIVDNTEEDGEENIEGDGAENHDGDGDVEMVDIE